MKLKGINIGLILILFSVAISCNSDNSNNVATIDGKYEISKVDLAEYHDNGYYGATYSYTKYKGYKKALDHLLLKKLKQVDFFNRGLHQNEEIISDIQRIINEEILVMYFEEEYLGKYINEEVIEDYYESLGRRVTYQQIVFNKSNTDNLEFLRNRANYLRNEAVNNGNFTELVRENSEDPASRERDGIMPTMTWKEGTSSTTNQVIFRMPPGTIKVIETARRVLVVKVNKVEEVPLPPMEESRSNIIDMLTQLYGPNAYNEYDRDKANLLDRNQYEWNEDGLNQLVEWSKINRFYFDENYKPIINEELENGNNFEILKYENGTVDLQKYLYLLNNILLIETGNNTNKNDFKQFIDEALRTELIIEKGKQLGYDEKVLSIEYGSDVILDEIVRLYDNQFVEPEIPEQNAENYQAFHEETKDSLFYQPDKVNLGVKIYNTKGEAQEVIDKLNSGIKFDELFNSWKIKNYYINKEGNIDNYTRVNESFDFGEEAFKLSEGESSGPIQFQENGVTKYAVINAINVTEEKILSINEIGSSRLERIFRQYYLNKINNELAEELKDKYSVKINESVLEELVPQSK